MLEYCGKVWRVDMSSMDIDADSHPGTCGPLLSMVIPPYGWTASPCLSPALHRAGCREEEGMTTRKKKMENPNKPETAK
jgi:hypothetical protein